MKLSCIHCGNEFTITADQLGGRGRCPHCRAEITLPKADTGESSASQPLERPSSWLENSISGLGSCLFHMIILVIIALIPWGGTEGIGEGQSVFIGQLPTENLSDAFDESLEMEQVEADNNLETLEMIDPIRPPGAETSEDPTEDILEVNTISPSGGAQNAINLESLQMTRSASSGGDDFDGLIRRLQRDGLDIAIVFDSTGSMSGEIREVKDQIDRIGKAIMKLVPKTRISICTYRDKRDDYVVKGLPLTNNIGYVKDYLDRIYAAGGGDQPEAVHEGLRWVVANNRFRSRARKVILVFGDAPPHGNFQETCVTIASEFRTQQSGIVSTVTCRSSQERAMPEFVEIAQAGGGEAFLTSNEREIMTQLVVLVFGSQHRQKVLEAFKLLGG